MAKLTRALIEELSAFAGEFCISIYLPTHRYGEAVKKGKDTIVLKNAINEIRDQLTETGMGPRKVESLTAPIRKLLEEPIFWNNQKDGLAVFAGENYFETVQLNTTMPKIQWVADHFYLTPLITHLEPKWEFFVLALDMKNVALYQANNTEIENITSQHPNLPIQMTDVVSEDNRSTGLQFRSQADTHGEATYHGHGGGKEVKKKEILQFFRGVNESLIQFLREQNKPLIILSQEYLFPVYKEANEYKNLLDEYIPRHPAEAKPGEIHDKAWALMQPRFMAERALEIKEFNQFHGTGNTSTDIQAIVRAARQGRVHTLFLAEGKDILGYYDKANDEVIIKEMPWTRKNSLFNDIAVHTFLAGGNVYELKQHEMPDNKLPVNAIIRS